MRLKSKVAFVTGAARGQGRAHAVRLAKEGARVVIIDACADNEAVAYPLPGPDELAQTADLVRAQGADVLARQVDVRDQQGLDAVIADALEAFGQLDIVCANAGITAHAKTWELSDAQWNEVVDVNLTGVWRTVKAAVPSMIERGQGGAIIITSSTCGLKGVNNHASYCAAKHGVVGLARTLALELAPYRVRVNTLHPTSVDTPMIQNDHEYQLFAPDHPHPTRSDAEPAFTKLNLIPDTPWLDPDEISSAIVWLASDEARHVTGIALPVDAGNLLR
jgi:(+)-trans-carveol dehydrogenase